MAKEAIALDIDTIPELREVVERVRLTGKPLAIEENGETVALISPAQPGRRRIPRAKAVTADDPIWEIVGMGSSGKGDISGNHDKYLVEAKISTMR